MKPEHSQNHKNESLNIKITNREVEKRGDNENKNTKSYFGNWDSLKKNNYLY